MACGALQHLPTVYQLQGTDVRALLAALAGLLPESYFRHSSRGTPQQQQTTTTTGGVTCASSPLLRAVVKCVSLLVELCLSLEDKVETLVLQLAAGQWEEGPARSLSPSSGKALPDPSGLLLQLCLRSLCTATGVQRVLLWLRSDSRREEA
eukprot:RCo055065